MSAIIENCNIQLNIKGLLEQSFKNLDALGVVLTALLFWMTLVNSHGKLAKVDDEQDIVLKVGDPLMTTSLVRLAHFLTHIGVDYKIGWLSPLIMANG